MYVFNDINIIFMIIFRIGENTSKSNYKYKFSLYIFPFILIIIKLLSSFFLRQKMSKMLYSWEYLV